MLALQLPSAPVCAGGSSCRRSCAVVAPVRQQQQRRQQQQEQRPSLRPHAQRQSLRMAAAQQQQQQLGAHEEVTGDTVRDKQLAALSLAASIGGGVALSMLHLDVDAALPAWAQQASSALGWSYTLAWSISFYPQILENARRQKVEGLSTDYLVYSLLGYAAYAAYTGALHFSPGVQAAYMAAHGGSAPDVQLTDFLFAGHALLVTLYTLYQCWLYGGNSSSGSSSPARTLATSRVCNLTAAGVLAAVAAYCGHIGGTCSSGDCDAWLPLLSLLGGIKVAMTLIKYTPQALLNAQRRSTDGWNINNVLLDLAGGMLSFAQVALNAAARGDTSVVTGNPAKLGISVLSVVFDAIFCAQHYLLYPPGSSAEEGGSSTQQQAGGSSRGSAGSSGGPGSSSGQPPAARRRMVAVAVRAAARGAWRE